MIPITPEIAEKIEKNLDIAMDLNTSIGKLMDEPQECEEAIGLLHKALDKQLCRISCLLNDGREQ